MLVYICEESKNDAIRLKHLLSTFSREKGLSIEMNLFASGEELSTACRQAQQQPDILFLSTPPDIENGREIARELQSNGYEGDIVYTISNAEYNGDKSDEAHLFCLRKPFDYLNLLNILEQCFPVLLNAQQSFSFVRKKKEISIPYGEILFFETGQPHTVVIHTTTESVIFRGALSQIADYFHNIDNFLPIGRSFVINLNHVTGRLRNDLIMSDGSIVQIPLRKQEDILQLVKKWQKNATGEHTYPQVIPRH